MKGALSKKTETKTDFKKISGRKHKTSKEKIIKNLFNILGEIRNNISLRNKKI